MAEQYVDFIFTVDVTRRARTVAATSDQYTAHPNLTWSTSTIQARLSFTQLTAEQQALGAVGAAEGVIKTADSLAYLDRFDYDSVRYEVITHPVDVRLLDGTFLWRKAGFRRVEFEATS